MQVDDINAPAVIAALQATGADRLVVAAFGQLLRDAVLERFMCLNVHASLLPAYRGAAPIERALAAGEQWTGISIMRMTEGLDEGPFALQTSVSIGLRDDAGSLGRALAVLGASGVDQVLTGLDDDTIVWTEQSGPGTYARKLTAADTFIDPVLPAKSVHDHVRALSPAIGVRARSGEVEFKVWRTWPYDGGEKGAMPLEALEVQGAAGTLAATNGRLFLGCGEGAVEILLVQPAGKARMDTSAFLRGYGLRLADKITAPREGTLRTM
jgi:methionyl-tRNA formyltransferase